MVDDLIIMSVDAGEWGEIAGTEAKVEDDKIVFTTAGSSSCPPTVERAYYDDPETVVLQIADYRGYVCTMDMRPYKQHIYRADGANFAEGTVVRVERP